MNASFSRKEKLKSKKLIEQMFIEGHSVTSYPLRLVFLETSFNDGAIIKTGVSVSKRNFKTAIDRNRIKRLLREAYRLHKAVYFNNISGSYALMILYIGKDGTNFDSVETKMKQLLDAFSKKVSQN